jgi:hypothetical protein
MSSRIFENKHSVLDMPEHMRRAGTSQVCMTGA